MRTICCEVRAIKHLCTTLKVFFWQFTFMFIKRSQCLLSYHQSVIKHGSVLSSILIDIDNNLNDKKLTQRVMWNSWDFRTKISFFSVNNKKWYFARWWLHLSAIIFVFKISKEQISRMWKRSEEKRNEKNYSILTRRYRNHKRKNFKSLRCEFYLKKT